MSKSSREPLQLRPLVEPPSPVHTPRKHSDSSARVSPPRTSGTLIGAPGLADANSTNHVGGGAGSVDSRPDSYTANSTPISANTLHASLPTAPPPPSATAHSSSIPIAQNSNPGANTGLSPNQYAHGHGHGHAHDTSPHASSPAQQLQGVLTPKSAQRQQKKRVTFPHDNQLVSGSTDAPNPWKLRACCLLLGVSCLMFS